MRVVHFLKSFSPLSQTFIYDYITEMDRQGVECRVLARTRENIRQRPFDHVQGTGVPPKWNVRRVWHKVAARGGSAPDPNYIWDLERRGIEERLEVIRPDVIHAHFGPAGVVVAPVAWRSRIPLVVTFYGYDASRLLTQPRWLDAYGELWRSASVIVVLSEDMKQRLQGAGCPSEKIAIVHLGKDLGEYGFVPPTHRVRDFISVGRLVEKKGHLDLVKAFHRLLALDPAVRLEIVGDGPLGDALEGYVESNGLGGSVTLTGALPHHEVIERLAASDAFVLCSRTASCGDREGTPTVLMEAQALGLPCVTTRHAGIPEVIPESNHWLLAEEGDVDGIAHCMMNLRACAVSDLETVAVRGRRQIESQFNISSEVRKLLRIYAAR